MAEQQINSVSVIDPVEKAIQTVKLICFSPFNLEKWFIIGFCAWLAYLGQGGGGFNFGPVGGEGSNTYSYPEISSAAALFILLLFSIVFVVGLSIMIALMWLTSRGRFMFLHCIVNNIAQVSVPWNLYSRQANSLFIFRLAAGFIFFISFVPFIIAVAICIGLLAKGSAYINIPIITATILLSVIIVILIIAFGLTMKFTDDFVIPIMFRHRLSCMQAWSYYMPLLRANKGRFAVYILFQIVLGIALSAIIIGIILATCCCAACILMIPYIGTVALLPIFVFRRSYSLMYLRQYGPEFDVFREINPFEPQQRPDG